MRKINKDWDNVLDEHGLYHYVKGKRHHKNCNGCKILKGKYQDEPDYNPIIGDPVGKEIS